MDQLQEIRDDFERASRRLDALAARIPAGAWFTRPASGRWSPGEHLAHLNLTATNFLPVIRDALARAPRLPSGSTRRLRRDPVGWFLWWVMPPPVRFIRVKTTANFMPAAQGDPEQLLNEFARRQAEQLECLAAADGLAIDRVTITSPIDNKARYNLFACFGILPRHQHRHLWLAGRGVE